VNVKWMRVTMLRPSDLSHLQHSTSMTPCLVSGMLRKLHPASCICRGACVIRTVT